MSKRLLQSLFVIPLALSPVVVSVACGKKTSDSTEQEQAQDQEKPNGVAETSSDYEITEDTFKFLFYSNDYVDSIDEQANKLEEKLNIVGPVVINFLNKNIGKQVRIINQLGYDEDIQFTVPVNGFQSYEEYTDWYYQNDISNGLGSFGTLGLVEVDMQSDPLKWRADDIDSLKDFMKRVKDDNRNSFRIIILSLPPKTVDITNLDNAQIDALTKEELIQLISV